MISAKHIVLKKETKTILDNVSLSVEPGGFTAIAGPNGAGKTSLLKILANELTGYSGEVTVNGKAIREYNASELSKIRSVLPQTSHLQFPFSVEQIIQMAIRSGKHSDRNSKQVREEVMHLTDTESIKNRNFLTLSGGEQQRVHLARVLVQVWETKPYPRYVLLDEPTSSLDIAQQELVFGLAKEACSRGIGVLAIVHDLNQVAQFADHLYFLRDGKMIANGKTKDVFTKTIIEETFCCRVNVYHDPCTNCPYIIPDRSKAAPLKTLKTQSL